MERTVLEKELNKLAAVYPTKGKGFFTFTATVQEAVLAGAIHAIRFV
jgi:hypothetical protein